MMNRSMRKNKRKKRALSARMYLQKILEKPNISTELRKNASNEIWKLSTRHSIGLPRNLKDRYCRKCKNLLFPGYNVKIRIRNKVRYLTCEECGTIKRKNLRD